MKKSQKIIACLTLVCFVVLYAFGWLWPLVRIALSALGFASLLASLYFTGIVVIAHFKKRDDCKRRLKSVAPGGRKAWRPGLLSLSVSRGGGSIIPPSSCPVCGDAWRPPGDSSRHPFPRCGSDALAGPALRRSDVR